MLPTYVRDDIIKLSNELNAMGKEETNLRTSTEVYHSSEPVILDTEVAMGLMKSGFDNIREKYQSEAKTDYEKYRGKCKEYVDALVANDSTLRAVRGWYECPMWGSQQHWWCEDVNGNIIDPTVKQFPTAGVCAEYREYDGIMTCEQCGDDFHEDKPGRLIDGHHTFCSYECYGHCVGF